MSAADGVPPVLTAMSLPAVVDVTSGGKYIDFSVMAVDEGLGVDRVLVGFARSWNDALNPTFYLGASDYSDSFADGRSSFLFYINASSAAGIYDISYVQVKDKAGNVSMYSASDLSRLALPTGFTIVNDARGDTAKPELISLAFPSFIDMAGGGKTISFTAGATDSGLGVESVNVEFTSFWQDARGATRSLSTSSSIDSFADGASTQQFFVSSLSTPGTYYIHSVTVFDKAGNYASYAPDQLAQLGIQTTFWIGNSAQADSIAPVLTSLSLPSAVDISNGSKTAAVAVGATDQGSGIDHVTIAFARSWQDHYGSQNAIELAESLETFGDGKSSGSVFFDSRSDAGSYDVTSLSVFDNAGNVTTYSRPQLAQLGFQTGFQIVDSNGAATAVVNAPAFVSEGNDMQIPLSVTLKNVTTASGTVKLEFVAGESTVPNGFAVDVPSYSSPFSVSQAAGDYVIALPSIDYFENSYDQALGTLAVRVTVTGQVFDSGTDNIVIKIPLVDNDVSGGTGNDVLIGGIIRDALAGEPGDDRLLGGLGPDTLTGGAGADRFEGTRSELSGDTITDLSAGDRVLFSDANFAGFAFERDGGTLSFAGGASIALTNGFNGRLIVTSASGDAVALLAAAHDAHLNDFDGNGHSDFLWHNVNGAVSTWEVAGNISANQVRQSAYNGAAATSWHVVESFDFNGDGLSDILWRNINGAVAVWGATSTGFDQGTYYRATSVPTDWRIAGAGNLNGDGKDDLIWQYADGRISTWNATGSGFVENADSHVSPGAGWKVEGLADFNGDGFDDILWRNTDGGVATWLNTGQGGFREGGFYAGGVPSSWHIDGAADFSGDGKADLLWRNDNGALSVWRSNGSGFDQGVYNSSAPTSWHIAATGDYNDDGKADILWHNDNGAVSTWQSTGAAFDQGVYNSAAPLGWDIAAHDFVL